MAAATATMAPRVRGSTAARRKILRGVDGRRGRVGGGRPPRRHRRRPRVVDLLARDGEVPDRRPAIQGPGRVAPRLARGRSPTPPAARAPALASKPPVTRPVAHMSLAASWPRCSPPRRRRRKTAGRGSTRATSRGRARSARLIAGAPSGGTTSSRKGRSEASGWRPRAAGLAGAVGGNFRSAHGRRLGPARSTEVWTAGVGAPRAAAAPSRRLLQGAGSAARSLSPKRAT